MSSSKWTPELEEQASRAVERCLVLRRDWDAAAHLMTAALDEIRRLRDLLAAIPEGQCRHEADTYSKGHTAGYAEGLDAEDCATYTRGLIEGARAMQEKCAVLLKPDPCSCNLYHGFCECGFDRMTALIEAIRGLKPANTLHDYGAMKRIEGARDMQENVAIAIASHLEELGWAAEQRQAIETVYKTIRALKPEDV